MTTLRVSVHGLRCSAALKLRCCLVRCYSTETSNIRNIGIVAHIDAGKTTVTEGILYKTGAIRAAGTIKHGTTTTDFLTCEQNRGITINSAFVQARWRDHLLNIIDTPGHIDFNFEVERSLRVLDGSLVVIDGTRGVEAQTVTVWNQLEKFAVPRIIFLNKLDRGRRNIDLCMSTIKEVLQTVPVLVNHPVIDDAGHLVGVSETSPSEATLVDTVESLAGLDEKMDELYFTHDCDASKISSSDIASTIKRLYQAGKVTPVCVGSGLSGIGIGSCLDLIIEYLPSPLDAIMKLPSVLQNQVCGVVFKSSMNPNRGVLCQSRLYSGTLKPRSKLFNTRTKTSAQVSTLFQVDADRVTLRDHCQAGDIIMFSGCKDFRTGDIFVADSLASGTPDFHGIVASNRTLKSTMSHGKPLFFCNIEGTDSLSNEKLEVAVTAMTFEDPTLSLEKTQGGELVLGGTGQLHLSVVRERLKDEHGLQCKAYKFRVNYTETVSETIEHHYEDECGDVHVIITPGHCVKSVDVKRVDPNTREIVELAIASCLTIGPLLGLQISNCHVTAIFNLNDIDNDQKSPIMSRKKKHSKDTTRRLTHMAKTAIRETFRTNISLMTLCEPVAEIEVEGPQQFSSAVLSDFSVRAGSMKYKITYPEGQEWFHLEGKAPLSKLADFSSKIRQISRGRASVLKIEMSEYSAMDLMECGDVVQMFKSGIM